MLHSSSHFPHFQYPGSLGCGSFSHTYILSNGVILLWIPGMPFLKKTVDPELAQVVKRRCHGYVESRWEQNGLSSLPSEISRSTLSTAIARNSLSFRTNWHSVGIVMHIVWQVGWSHHHTSKVGWLAAWVLVWDLCWYWSKEWCIRRMVYFDE